MPCSEIPEYNFTLYKGDDKTKMFRYKADDLPVDITGYVITFESTAVTLNQEATIVDTADGRYDFIFTKEVTVALTENRIKYEVVFYPAGLLGEKITKYRGSINLIDEVVL